MKKQLKNVGFTTTFLGIVLSALLGVQLLAIVLLTQGVNVTTSSLADLMQRSNEYQQAATKLQAGTSVLAETAAAFVQSPIVQGGPDAGSFNAGPLRSYAQELSLNRRGAQIAAQFQEYDVSEEVRGCIDAAAAYSEQIGDIQTHAISLLLSVYPLPDEPVLRTIPLIELTEEERALSAEERVAAAKALMFGRDYSLLKSYVYENTEKCHALLRARFNAATAESERHVAVLRAALWAAIFGIVAALALALVLFRCWLVKPLRRYAEDMQNDRKLSRQGRIRELWSMAAVYNEVPERRDTLESYLRAAAETDVLTGLPNRYHLEQNTGDLEKWDGTLAVLLFDVNFLKRVNDTRGHLAGDQLLRRTAHIIGECFGTESCANCYRIGGDEFAAILRDCTEADVLERMDAFARAQEREGISVSVGCAIDENTDAHTFRRLMELADRRMYEQKQRAHRLVAR